MNHLHIRRRLEVPSRAMQTDEEEASSSDSVPCLMEVSNDGPTCNFPRYYWKCGIDNELKENQTSTINVSVLFDYELHFSGRRPPVEFLEGLLLEHLAGVLLLDDCGRRQLSSSVSIVGISSNPADQIVSDGT
jgi:hypothetical protein